jgi:hypothetical protein
MTSRPPIDLSIVAGRRPSLLRDTLDSFSERMFSSLSIGKVIVNIDPVFGDETDLASCIAIVQEYLPSAGIRTPQEAGFCAAVKHNWQATTAPVVFHLEDDWLLNCRFDDACLSAFAEDPSLGQLSLNTREKNWDVARRGPYHSYRPRIGLGPFRLPAWRRRPKFTTSPSFLRGDFARAVAQRLDTAYDPEKQMYSGLNPALERFLRDHRNRIVTCPDGGYPITDIGRAWRDTRGIRKLTRGGRSHWEAA